MTRDIFSKNADYQKFEVLKSNRNKRHRYGEFFVEGVRNLNQARENGWEFAAFLYARDRALSRWAQEMLEQVPAPIHYRLAGELLDSLSGKEDGSELMAVVKMRQGGAQLLRRPANPLWVLFDRPSNKGNLGPMIRSCDALGADMLIMTGHSVDLYDPDVVVSAMGSFFKLPVVRVSDNNALWDFVADVRRKHPGFQMVGTTAHKQNPVYEVDLTGPVMLMVGNETMGLNQNFKDSCDLLCTIPMAEDSYASSFNVSCAASILMYEVMRQRSAARRGSEEV